MLGRETGAGGGRAADPRTQTRGRRRARPRPDDAPSERPRGPPKERPRRPPPSPVGPAEVSLRSVRRTRGGEGREPGRFGRARPRRATGGSEADEAGGEDVALDRRAERAEEDELPEPAAQGFATGGPVEPRPVVGSRAGQRRRGRRRRRAGGPRARPPPRRVPGRRGGPVPGSARRAPPGGKRASAPPRAAGARRHPVPWTGAEGEGRAGRRREGRPRPGPSRGAVGRGARRGPWPPLGVAALSRGKLARARGRRTSLFPDRSLAPFFSLPERPPPTRPCRSVGRRPDASAPRTRRRGRRRP